MSNSDIKYHISIAERNKWNKVIVDLNNHIGSGGINNHRLGNGSIPGFSTNDYTNEEKSKLARVQEGALNNPHPPTHPYTMITGLHSVAHTGNYNELINRPTHMPAQGGNADTVNGIRLSIQDHAPHNPQNYRELWINPSNRLMYIFRDNSWFPLGAVYL